MYTDVCRLINDNGDLLVNAGMTMWLEKDGNGWRGMAWLSKLGMEQIGRSYYNSSCDHILYPQFKYVKVHV